MFLFVKHGLDLFAGHGRSKDREISNKKWAKMGLKALLGTGSMELERSMILSLKFSCNQFEYVEFEIEDMKKVSGWTSTS